MTAPGNDECMGAVMLQLGDEAVRFVGGPAGPGGVVIAPGLAAIRRDFLDRPGSPGWRLEAAIAAVEDVLALVPRSLHGLAVSGAGPALGGIATAAGLDGAASRLTREAVERLFSRQAAVAEGRPAAVEGLPADPAFVAALVVVRESMHHLDIDAITLAHEPVR